MQQTTRRARNVYLDQLGRDFSANKVDFYSSAENRGLVEGVIGCIKGGAPLSIETSLRALQLGNSRVVGIVREYVDRFGALEHPEHGEYEVGLKHCVDARSAIINLVLSLRFNTIHERTAGSVVRNGGVFRVLSPLGRGFVSTHKSCGGEATAHELHTHGKRAEDPQIDHITDSIPHAVAIIEDPDRRSRWNARSQVVNAAAMLDSHSLGNEVHPTFENWGRWADRVVDLEWLSTNQPDPDNIFKALRATMVDIWTTALSRGITPEKQFSHAIIYYDPYRLGTINDPRSIFDASPNELFCVTEDFRHATNGGGLSLTAVGSLRYAGFFGGGHVAGVGKKDGNRHIVILDTDLDVVLAVKRKLLASAEDIHELTKNGETITLALYNPDTAEVTLLPR
ncbi:MAG: hypothetical protein ACP5N9_05180 [Candidatus Bilamarchaeum sp.]